MARVSYPIVFSDWIKLFKEFKLAYDALPFNNPLVQFLNHNAIDLNVLETAANEALEVNEEFKKSSKDAEKFTQERKKIFKPAFVEHRKCVQFLKSYYADNARKLGDWKVTVNNNNRVVYKSNFRELQQEIVGFITKHESYSSGTSPLQGFLDDNNINLELNQLKAVQALQAHEDSIEKRRKKESLRQERDKKIAPVKAELRGIAGYLVKLFANNPHKAGDFGFTIDHSPRKRKIRKGILAAGEKKTLTHFVNGSTFTNIGQTTILIYSGKSTNGKALNLNAGESFIISRKYGTITMINDNNLSKAAYNASFIR